LCATRSWTVNIVA